jgi:hypothetical protein
MPGILGHKLKNPLNFEMTARMTEMQLQAKYTVIEIAERSAVRAKKQGKNFTEDFRTHEVFRKTLMAFKFFAKHKLVANAEAALADFENYVDRQAVLIDQSKNYQ